MHEKRIFQRKALRTKIFFEDEFGEPLIWLESRDLSLGGVFVDGDIPIRVGSHTFISFMLNGEKISATAEVARTPNGGVGLRFIGLSLDAERAIKLAIS